MFHNLPFFSKAVIISSLIHYILELDELFFLFFIYIYIYIQSNNI